MLRIAAHSMSHALLFVMIASAALMIGACSSTGNSYNRAPVLSSMSPAHGSRGVPLNAMLSVDFDRPMGPLNSSNFTLRQGNTPVPGTVSTSEDGSSATFMPSNRLAENTGYTAVVSRDVKSIAGTKMVTERSWSFTTGTSTDSKAPKVTSARPTTGSTGIAINSPIVVTFDEAIDPFSVTPATFSLMSGTTAVSGMVEYGPGTTAKFIPAGPLKAETLYTATVSAAVKDLQGNRLSNPMTWSFTTGDSTYRGPSAIGLGSSANYVILSKTLISSVPNSTVTGDIGIFPAKSNTHLVGFAQTTKDDEGFSTSNQVNGKIYCDAAASPAPANLKAAVSNMEAAYSDAASRQDPDYKNLNDGNIGGKTLSPGLYCWETSVSIPTDVRLSGGAGDVWIFQISGDLFISSGKKILLADGAMAKNVFWQVAGQTIIGPDAHCEGTILSKSGVTLVTGATMNGRILTQGSVALQQARVTQAAK